MNKVIAGQDLLLRHLIKDASFNILSLANQLYRSKSTHPDGYKYIKIYFSENQVLELII